MSQGLGSVSGLELLRPEFCSSYASLSFSQIKWKLNNPWIVTIVFRPKTPIHFWFTRLQADKAAIKAMPVNQVDRIAYLVTRKRPKGKKRIEKKDGCGCSSSFSSLIPFFLSCFREIEEGRRPNLFLYFMDYDKKWGTREGKSSRISFSILEEDIVAFSSSYASSIDRSDLAAMINKATAISI
ncbi:hypothetical protein E6C27_scaffold795G00440 [Cucumis melo var. makuwa]|uniref:Uncharacterized protein n=1 Tax=Cucumis melo var. makuwa TaxID=1194695 RepID=A0A5A7TK66_CUCMM|nr:hypothetical protein E6C27_scaffold795G00440 [Cucumis melo var. makuwa]